jgi:predicted ATPase
MFIARAGAAGQRLPYPPDEAASIAPLVEMLEKLPLAIELAAARAGLMTPSAPLRRMSERFQLFASLRRAS